MTAVAFRCPHNTEVEIMGKCCINECPYHMDRVSQLFAIDHGETNCVHYDSNLMQNVSVKRTQISALSREPRRRLSPKLMRSSFEDAVQQTKTLYTLTHSVSNTHDGCKNCGYPIKAGIRCVSVDLCKARKEWVKFICSQYSVEENITKFKIIWQLLFKNEISASEATLKNGFALCSSKEITKLINDPNVTSDFKEILNNI